MKKKGKMFGFCSFRRSCYGKRNIEKKLIAQLLDRSHGCQEVTSRLNSASNSVRVHPHPLLGVVLAIFNATELLARHDLIGATTDLPFGFIFVVLDVIIIIIIICFCRYPHKVPLYIL